MNNKKHIVNLEYFKEILHICPRLPNQTFDELLFEDEILAFLRYLGHSGEIKKLTDVNIHKLHQPWRSFAAVINKCLNFVYQVEHKDSKKSNEMYYPRDDQMFITIKLVPRHQNTQQFGVMLPVELTNEDIRNSKAYKEYYVIASGAVPPKTKASVRKTKSSFDTKITPPTAVGTRILTLAKGKQPAKSSKAKDEGTGVIPGVLGVPTDESDEEISCKSSDEDDDDEVDDRSNDQEDDDDQDDDNQDDNDQDDNNDDQDTDNDGDDFIHPKLSIHEEEAKDEESFDPIDAKDDDKELYRDVNINLEGQDSLSVSSQFVTSMLNPSPDAGIDSLFETTPRVDVQASTTVAPLTLTALTLPPSTIPTISETLEANFSEFVQTNQFARAVSSIPGIVERYMDQRMNKAVKVDVQMQSNRLRDEAQAENEEFLNNLEENIQKIIKEQVKEQVKVQLSKILPKIEKTVNEQLEAKVLTRSSNSSKTSYAVAANLSELELKKIIIEKIESNKSIYRSNKQWNLYKALVDAYECDKIILDTYGDTVTLSKRDQEVTSVCEFYKKRRWPFTQGFLG
uniref:Uncharacterized protein n=1 Tax=Tanacetum cinerariifolium TaxID=118510 RepID=A0A699HLS7_TANCI|nr:hypothetical protein [Tanacetum cinerariifolium]